MNNSSSQNQTAPERRCLYCGQLVVIIWVHGHGQCAACGVNVEECCSGENCFNGVQGHSPQVKNGDIRTGRL